MYGCVLKKKKKISYSQCCRSKILYISCSPASKVWHLLLLAGDIKLNPDPVPKECSANPKRICKSKDRFMAVVFSMSAELLVNCVCIVYVCFKNSNSDIPPSAFKVAKHQKR